MSSCKHTFIKSYPPIQIRIEVARHVLGKRSVTCVLFLWFLIDLPIDSPAVNMPVVDKPAVDKPAVDMPAVISAIDLSAVDVHAVDTPAVDLPVDFSVNSEALMYKEMLT